MSNVDAVAARLRRLLHWAAFVGCAAAAVAIGLLTDGAFLYAAAEPETAAPIAHIDRSRLRNRPTSDLLPRPSLRQR
jgi:hypothetical protein